MKNQSKVLEARLRDTLIQIAELDGLIDTIVNDLSGLSSLRALVRVATKKISEIFPVAWVALYLATTVGGTEISVAAKRGRVPKSVYKIAKRAYRKGSTLICNGVLALPIGTEGRILGVVVAEMIGNGRETRTKLLVALSTYLAKLILQLHSQQAIAKQVPQSVLARLPLDAEDLVIGSEKATVTIMFADIRGFTQLSEEADPETVRNFINRYFALMDLLIKSHDGTVVKFLADGVLAVFGAPESCPDHSLKAIVCGLSAVDLFKRELSGFFPGRSLAVGVGIARGMVHVGMFGSPERLAFDVIGNTVNRASRIQGTAVNAVHIDSGTFRTVSRRIKAKRLPKHSLKGLSDPGSLYEVEKVLDLP